MPTTTNNGWTTPADTALVKDGASAIRTLGQAIDTTLGVYQSPGLVKISTTTFTGVASQSINDVFSATYENYKIIISLTAAADEILGFRVRVSSADLTTSTYKNVVINGIANPNSSNAGGQTTTRVDLGNSSTGEQSYNVEVYKPFLTVNSRVVCTYVDNRSSYSTGVQSSIVNNSTSYTGFTLFSVLSGGNISGKVSVYGYNF